MNLMLANARRLIIKIGSSLLVDEEGRVCAAWLASLAEDIAALKREGRDVVIVTSGAVGLGRAALKFGTRALELEEKQAAAACGQPALMRAWQEAFQPHGIATAQILLTADDSIQRRRYLNARATLETLLAEGAIPIINENDTVATAELRFGDNDRLSARVAMMASADVLVIFSDIDGLFSADPRTHAQAVLVEEVHAITPEIEAMAGGAGSAVGTGGMSTKLAAAKIALAAGCHMVIARGTAEHPLRALLAGGKHTRFIASETPLSARKKWIAGSMHPAGALVVDAGAEAALASGKSLLPAGVTAVEGTFDRGDAVVVKNAGGRALARGLVAYSAEEAARILGHKTQEIERILGYAGPAALVHRDDLVVE